MKLCTSTHTLDDGRRYRCGRLLDHTGENHESCPDYPVASWPRELVVEPAQLDLLATVGP